MGGLQALPCRQLAPDRFQNAHRRRRPENPLELETCGGEEAPELSLRALPPAGVHHHVQIARDEDVVEAGAFETIGHHGLHDEENASTAAFWARDIAPLRWTGPTVHQDLAPTILQALDVPLGTYTGTVVGRAPADRALVSFDYLVGYSIPLISVVQENLKLMYDWDGTMRFYDLAVDPGEQMDQFDAADPDVKRLWGVLDPIVERMDEIWPDLARVPPAL